MGFHKLNKITWLLVLVIMTGFMLTENNMTFAEGEPDYASTKNAAEQGDATAQYILGNMYHNGEGIPPDDKQAVDWYKKAAGQGNAEAQYALGFMYHFGKGIPQDESQAQSWSKKAADLGNEHAQRALNYTTLLEGSTNNNKSEGYSEETKPIKKTTDDVAQQAQREELSKEPTSSISTKKSSSVIYSPSSIETTLATTKKTAEQENVDVNRALEPSPAIPSTFVKLETNTKSQNKSVDSIKQKADQGNALAQLELGNLYYKGKWVHQDDKQAIYWWSNAAKQGNKDAWISLESNVSLWGFQDKNGKMHYTNVASSSIDSHFKPLFMLPHDSTIKKKIKPHKVSDDDRKAEAKLIEKILNKAAPTIKEKSYHAICGVKDGLVTCGLKFAVILEQDDNLMRKIHYVQSVTNTMAVTLAQDENRLNFMFIGYMTGDSMPICMYLYNKFLAKVTTIHSTD